MTDKKTAGAEESLWDGESTGGELFKFDTVGQSLKGLITVRKQGKTKLGDAVFVTVQEKDGEKTFVPTKACLEDIDKMLRQYGGVNKTIVEIEFMEEKKGNYPSPFKVFRVRAGTATESRLAALGIATFDSESTNEEDEAPL